MKFSRLRRFKGAPLDSMSPNSWRSSVRRRTKGDVGRCLPLPLVQGVIRQSGSNAPSSGKKCFSIAVVTAAPVLIALAALSVLIALAALIMVPTLIVLVRTLPAFAAIIRIGNTAGEQGTENSHECKSKFHKRLSYVYLKPHMNRSRLFRTATQMANRMLQ